MICIRSPKNRNKTSFYTKQGVVPIMIRTRVNVVKSCLRTSLSLSDCFFFIFFINIVLEYSCTWKRVIKWSLCHGVNLRYIIILRTHLQVETRRMPPTNPIGLHSNQLASIWRVSTVDHAQTNLSLFPFAPSFGLDSCNKRSARPTAKNYTHVSHTYLAFEHRRSTPFLHTFVDRNPNSSNASSSTEGYCVLINSIRFCACTRAPLR